jgi:hypothetical protein
MKKIKEAIELCLEVEEPISNEFIGVQKSCGQHMTIFHR